MKVNVISIFPQMFESWTKFGLIGQAIQKGSIDLRFINPRDYAKDKHRTVDDRPFGGGDGMVLLYEPLSQAIEGLLEEKQLGRLIYMSPSGQRLTSAKAEELAQLKEPITLLAGRYGGIDQRVVEKYVDEELSVGDYILSGGELPAMTLIDAIGRYLPGVLGNEASSQNESFSDGLLEAPLFTRPAEVDGAVVPEVFLQGHHQKINDLRRQLSLVITFHRRPDLIENRGPEVSRAAEALLQLRAEELESCGLTLDMVQEALRDER